MQAGSGSTQHEQTAEKDRLMKTPKILSPARLRFLLFPRVSPDEQSLWVTIAAYGAEDTATPVCTVYYGGEAVSESGCIHRTIRLTSPQRATEYADFSRSRWT